MSGSGQPGTARDTILPTERVSFFDELARRRRGARILSAVCLLIAAGIGVVMSSVVTPLVLLAAGGILHLIAGVGIYPTTARAMAHDIGTWTAARSNDFDMLVTGLDKVHGFSDIGLIASPLLYLASVALPALGAAAIVWVALRHVSLRGEGGDLVARLAARDPSPDDPEERQAANIAAEIAIAASITPPRLLMIDDAQVNAAAIGPDGDHATLLVSRGVLDALDRDETSAVVAHLVASAAQGDMRLTHGILAVYQTLGFFVTFLDLPFRLSAWRALGGMTLVMIGIRRKPQEVTRTLETVEASLDADTMPDVEKLWSFIPIRWLRMTLLVPLLPFLLISLLLRVVLFLWTALFLGPPLALIWRTRRYQADAMAVQLTRNPEALARALARIGGSGIPPGGEGREYCFIQGPGMPKRGFAERRTITVSLHPPLARRLARLAALGASAEWGRRHRWDWAALFARPWLALLVGGLLLMLVPLGIALVACIAFLTAIAMTMGLAAGLMIVTAVLT